MAVKMERLPEEAKAQKQDSEGQLRVQRSGFHYINLKKEFYHGVL